MMLIRIEFTVAHLKGWSKGFKTTLAKAIMTTEYTALGHNIQQHRQGLLDYSLAHLSILAHFCFRNRKEGLFSFVPLLPYIHEVNVSHTASVFDLSLNYSTPFPSWGNHTCSESHRLQSHTQSLQLRQKQIWYNHKMAGHRSKTCTISVIRHLKL